MSATIESRPLALITGASSGIGRELAIIFAEEGYDLIIAAEDAELAAAGAELERQGVAVTSVRTDLATFEGVENLLSVLGDMGRPIDAAALNAGIGLGGDFAHQDRDAALRLVHVNVVSTVHLSKYLVSEMAAKGSGKVLFTSSIAAMSPGPYQALYNASKSFIQSFAEAIKDELRDSGVSVTALQPGPTDTEFFERAGLEDTKLGSGKKDDPAKVARQGFDALMAGEAKVIAGGLKSKVQGEAMKVMPDKVKAAMHREQTRPGSGG
jgi:short-subunit dehydrogenase